ncbi:MAG: Lpg1974 family pore-forming outer membrane protein, partial [Chlamydiota bacterium]
MSFTSVFRKQSLLYFVVFLFIAPRIQADSLHVPQNNFHSECWTVTMDYLAWYASEEVASIWADVITIGDNRSSWEARGFNFNWGQGSRLGISRALNCDQWKTAFYWTWFQTSNHKKIPFQDNARISPEFFAAFLSGNTPQNMSGKWSLLLNMFDWELGRECCVCKNFSVRPFVGIKGGWIHQTIKVKYGDLVIDNIPTDFSADEHLTNNFSGVGPLVGVNTKWKIGRFCSSSVSLIGDLSLATLFGSWSCDDFYENTVSQTSSVT